MIFLTSIMGDYFHTKFNVLIINLSQVMEGTRFVSLNFEGPQKAFAGSRLLLPFSFSFIFNSAKSVSYYFDGIA